MEIREQLYLPIQESSQISDARRRVTQLAKQFGFSDALIGKVALVTTECATNLDKHARNSGVMIAQIVSIAENLALEILALDKGRGITNIAEALRDGYSTAGSPGTGLGAIVRLSDTFDIYSVINEGTAILARLWSQPPTPEQVREAATFGAICLPKLGEEVSGDAWAFHRERERFLITLVDGLGHGIGAAEAAQAAIKAFKASTQRAPLEIMKQMHLALQATRGAVLGVAEIDLPKQVLHFGGVGNIEGGLYTEDNLTRFVSQNGTAGYDIARVKVFDYPIPDDAIMVMTSDGVTSHLNLNRYTALKSRDAALIAGVLYRDFNRGRDDTTVLVLKLSAYQ
jgi:anti-sigma regulatory factor (Ser/Thr protein kinase)